MVTDGILGAVQMIIDRFKTSDEIYAAKIMWVMYEHPELDFMDMAMRFMDIRKRVYTFPKMGEKAYFIAVPTSAGTGSEVTPFAVITDETTGQKYPLADYELLPKMAIVDANLMMNAPKGLSSCTRADVSFECSTTNETDTCYQRKS